MDYLNGKTFYLKKDHAKVGARLAQVSLKDVPLEVIRKEAKNSIPDKIRVNDLLKQVLLVYSSLFCLLFLGLVSLISFWYRFR